MQYITSLVVIVAGLSLPYQTVNAAPTSTLLIRNTTDSDPAMVNFAPFKEIGCRMSGNPHDPTRPTGYNITTASGCVTPAYAWASYVESANDQAANGPCSLNIYSGQNCTGDVTAGVRTTFGTCMTDSNAAGQSLRLLCDTS